VGTSAFKKKKKLTDGIQCCHFLALYLTSPILLTNILPYLHEHTVFRMFCLSVSRLRQYTDLPSGNNKLYFRLLCPE